MRYILIVPRCELLEMLRLSAEYAGVSLTSSESLTRVGL